jgi:hypothetical protein
MWLVLHVGEHNVDHQLARRATDEQLAGSDSDSYDQPAGSIDNDRDGHSQLRLLLGGHASRSGQRHRTGH